MKIIATLAFSANETGLSFFVVMNFLFLCFLSPFHVYHPQKAMNNINITYIIQTLASRLIPLSLSLSLSLSLCAFSLAHRGRRRTFQPRRFHVPRDFHFIRGGFVILARVHVFCASTFARVKRFLGFSKPFFSPTLLLPEIVLRLRDVPHHFEVVG